MGTGKHLMLRRPVSAHKFGAVFLLLVAVLAAARPPSDAETSSSDPLANAGTLLNECKAVAPAAVSICTELSTAIANGHDPSLNLPTASSVNPGDLHIAGPWKESIVVRKHFLGRLKAYAVGDSSAGSSNVVVTMVNDAAEAAALNSNQSAGNSAQGQTVQSTTQFEEGWVTEVHPSMIPDGTVLSPAVVSEYISNSPSVHYLGEYADTLPIRTDFINAEYTWHGLFKVDQPGDYRFAVTFVPAQIAAVDSWECFAHLDFVDANNRIPALPDDPVEFEAQTPPARIRNLISGKITMPAGLNELQLDAVCNPGQKWNLPAFGASLRQNPGLVHTSGVWPLMVLRVQRPGTVVFGPLRDDEIVHDPNKYPNVKTVSDEALAAAQRSADDPLEQTHLPSSFKPGWYVDVYPIVGTDKAAWLRPPEGPIQATFIAPPEGFSLTDHRLAGMTDKDGKIYVANSEFLALKSGEYTFYVDPSNPNVANSQGSEVCVVDLIVTDKHRFQTHIIEGDKPNAYYTGGMYPFSEPAIGAANLGRGAYRMALRTACNSSAEVDITADPWAATRFTIYTLSPGEDSVHPINPGEFVYRLAKRAG
jgi:hypothetical protein